MKKRCRKSHNLLFFDTLSRILMWAIKTGGSIKAMGHLHNAAKPETEAKDCFDVERKEIALVNMLMWFRVLPSQ